MVHTLTARGHFSLCATLSALKQCRQFRRFSYLNLKKAFSLQGRAQENSTLSKEAYLSLYSPIFQAIVKLIIAQKLANVSKFKIFSCNNPHFLIIIRIIFYLQKIDIIYNLLHGFYKQNEKHFANSTNSPFKVLCSAIMKRRSRLYYERQRINRDGKANPQTRFF